MVMWLLWKEVDWELSDKHIFLSVISICSFALVFFKFIIYQVTALNFLLSALEL